MDWLIIWQELRTNLKTQRRCSTHPEFSCVKTLSQGIVNDILEVDELYVRVRSHRTLHNDDIEAARFKTWWEWLVANGSASLSPGDDNNPHPWRARIMGAVFVTCLPNRIKQLDSNTIELRR
jgi:hypothetical protein